MPGPAWFLAPARARHRTRGLPSGVFDLGIDRAYIEIEGVVIGRSGVALGEVGRDVFGDLALAPATAA
jgi:hypothetical protein